MFRGNIRCCCHANITIHCIYECLIEGCNCKSRIQLINEPKESYIKLGPQLNIILAQMKLSIIFVIFFFLVWYNENEYEILE